MNYSPWADGSVADEPIETTAELLKIADQERMERESDEIRNRRLWEKFAHRLTLDGDLIR